MKVRSKIATAAGVIVLFAVLFVIVPSATKRPINPNALVITEYRIGRASYEHNAILVSNAWDRPLEIRLTAEVPGGEKAKATTLSAPYEFAAIRSHWAWSIETERFVTNGPFRLRVTVSKEIKRFEHFKQIAIRAARTIFEGSSSPVTTFFGPETNYYGEIMNAGTNRVVELHP